MLFTRRHRFAAVLTIAAFATTATACSAGSSPTSDSDEPIVIDYAWWGSTAVDADMAQAIEAFEDKNPGIKIDGESTPWDGYWDKLATVTAGGDAPDVMLMSVRYILEYGQRGALADLDAIDGLDVSKLDAKSVDLGRGPDSTLYALPTGLSTYTIAANVDLFDKAGVELPDDSTWTWDDYYETSQAISDALGVAGTGYGLGISPFRPWVHQQGEDLYNEDGSAAGFSRDTLVSYLKHILTVRDSGGLTADQLSESTGQPVESIPWGQNQQAMNWIYPNELGSHSTAAGAHMELLRIPSQTGSAEDNGMYYTGSAFYSISAKSEPAKQEAAMKFVNFLLNDEEGARAIGLDLGVPANPGLVEALKPELDEADAQVADFINEISNDVTVDTPGPDPIGAADVQEILTRNVLELLYDRLSIDDATDNIINEINSVLG